MTVASVTEISAASSEGFEQAIREGIDRATSTLRGVEGCWVKDMNVLIDNGSIVGYKVNLAITFVMEDAAGGSSGTGIGPEDAPRQPTGA
jgi:flavin-binding protein dodecin